MTESLFIKYYHSPLGTYLLASSRQGVVCVTTANEAETRLARWERHNITRTQQANEHNDALAQQLDDYFAGELRRFGVPLDLRGTPFQIRVWKLVRGIPYGETRSYRQLACFLKPTSSPRAVGRALGSNPVAIIVPCHRVIEADGSLTGYAGGLPIKRALLDLEANSIRA